MSATASGEPGSGSRLSALARRACASSWWPSRCSTPAHAVVSLVCNASDSLGCERDALQQSGVALGELTGGGERSCTGEQELDALLGRARLREES